MRNVVTSLKMMIVMTKRNPKAYLLRARSGFLAGPESTHKLTQYEQSNNEPL